MNGRTAVRTDRRTDCSGLHFRRCFLHLRSAERPMCAKSDDPYRHRAARLTHPPPRTAPPNHPFFIAASLFAARITGTNSIWLLSIQFGKVCIYEEAQRCCHQNVQTAPQCPKPDTIGVLADCKNGWSHPVACPVSVRL
jgi:hypothetical protein